jgi:ATP-dependent Clp protease ATP-binding subunit ClpA
VFHPLDREDVRQITLLMLGETAARVKQNVGVALEYTEALVMHIAEDGYDHIYGARPLRRAIQNKIEDELAEAMLRGEFKDGDRVGADFADGKVVFSKNTSGD